MNLRRSAHLTALGAISLIVALSSLFLFTYAQKNRMERRIEVLETLRFDAMRLHLAIFDYVLYQEDRPRLQVEGGLGDLRALLDSQAQAADRTWQDDPNRTLWETVQRRLAECETHFTALVRQRTDPNPVFQERNRRTVDLLLLSSQSLGLSLSQIHRMAVKEFRSIAQYERLMLWVLLASLLGLSLSLFIALRRSILRPLQQLHETVLRVAGGDWTIRLRGSRRDEWGLLARAFNNMLDQLQETTVSRDRLEAEIQERRRTDEALRQSEATLQEAQRLAGIGHWKWDLRTDAHTWSEEIYRLYGRDPALPPAVYPEVQQYFTPESWAQLAAAVEQGVAAGVSYECDAEVVRPDGSHGWIVARGEAACDTEGNIINLHGTVQDITERKQAEAEIRRLNAELEERVRQRTAELQATNQELESFIYAVSHDLRAPLRAMSGFSQALVEDYGERLDGQAQSYLDQIAQASHHMSELIDGLLALSRSTRGGMRRDAVDLTALAERLLAERVAAEPERQVEGQVAPNLCVRGDALMLEIVMRNLIENAWKYTARTPKAIIRVYAETQDDQRYFCIADNGAGFDMRHAHRLFQVFQRLHRQDEFPGIGIGLATAQRIIRRHGGDIQAQSAPGQGATFCFTVSDTHAADKETS